MSLVGAKWHFESLSISQSKVIISFSAVAAGRETGGKLYAKFLACTESGRKKWLLKQHLGLGISVSSIIDMVASIQGASITLPFFEGVPTSNSEF